MPVGIVGAFNPQSRRGRKLPDNPFDRATVVSVYPEAISDKKPTVFPGEWTIPAAPAGGFSLLVFGTSSWWGDLGEQQNILEIPVNSYEMAKSFVNDYCNGLLGCDMGNKMPGLFYIPGSYDEKKILGYTDETSNKTFKTLLEEARAKQKNYFSQLVKMSDALWARTNGNPLTISHTARLAAEQLGLKNKPWMGDFSKLEMINCPACGNLVNPMYPICANCKTVINKEKAKELGLVSA